MKSKVSRRLSETIAPEVCENIYGPRLEKEFNAVFAPMTDINQAHVIMLAKQKLLSRETAEVLARALLRMEEEGPGVVNVDPRREDAYFNYEAHLIGLIGTDIGGRMHVARSRNDLGAAIDRIRARGVLLDLVDALNAARRRALEVAARYTDVVMPGYTHLQPAQPVTYGFYLAGIAAALERDGQRLAAAFERTNLSPLGAAAFAGTTFPIDRDETSRLLGFSGLIENTLDAVASRDFGLELMAALTQLAVTWSRIAQDYFVFVTHEFQTIEFPDSVAGTSSIMPQKKNPVVLEHLKGKAGHVLGLYVSSATAMKATHFTNTNDGNREGMRGLWEAAEETQRCLVLVELVLRTARPNAALMLRRAKEDFATATDLADALVRDADLSFREAHHVVGGVVRAAMDAGLAADGITTAMIDEVAREQLGRPLGLPEDLVRRSLDPQVSVNGRSLPGGPAATAVQASVDQALSRLLEEAAVNRYRRAALTEARQCLKREIAALANQ